MAEALLQTKITVPPPRSHLVPRPRLIERLNRGLQGGRQLSLLAAPAGYGKTILASSWLQQSDRPAAWLTLDDADNDPARFWTYLLAALQMVGVDQDGHGVAQMQTPQPAPLTAVLTTLINELAASPRSLTLVLDDYHVIHNQAIHEGISFLLQHQPGQFHLVMTTRADPQLPLARLRAQRALTEIRQGDLRFSVEESNHFLNEVMTLDLTTQEIEALVSRTEGWAVGLVLAGQSVQGRDDKQAFIRAFSGSHRYILEYLVEEVLRHQPPGVRQFLIQTSVLTRFCGPLCDAVTGKDDSQQILDELQRSNLFIIPLDDERRWFRFHHLFSDLLGNLCRRELSPGQIGTLHRRASQWYEQDTALDDAVRHALLSGDFELASTVIERSAQLTIAQGRLITLLNWLATLPEASLLARPRLRVYQAWALHLSGDHETAERVLQAVRENVRASRTTAESIILQGQIAAMLVGIATMDEDMDAAIREAREALATLPEDDLVSRARVHVALGTAQAYGDDLARAVATWEQARDMALAAGNPFLATAAVELLAGTRIYFQGRLRDGAALLQQVIEWGTTEDGGLLPFTAVAHTLLGEVYLEWNDLETAARYLDKGVDLLGKAGIGYGVMHAYCAQARLSQALNDPAGAREALAIAEQALGGRPLTHMIVQQIAYQVRFRLWSGDLTGAWRWATAEPAIVGRDFDGQLPRYLAEAQGVSLAQVYLAREEAAEALAILDGLLPDAMANGRMARAAEIQLYRALALWDLGDASAALEAFERCLAITEAEGYVRLYLEAGEPVLPLLSRAKSRGIFTAYGTELLAALETAAIGPGLDDKGQQGLLVDPLSDRETQVLRLIEAGHTNRQIAEALVVSLNTVKKHTGSIYSKLQVHSRTQAVARARELGLL